MIVMKFGGTSVKDVAAVRRLAGIVRAQRDRRRWSSSRRCRR